MIVLKHLPTCSRRSGRVSSRFSTPYLPARPDGTVLMGLRFSIASMPTRLVLLHAIVWPMVALLTACGSAPPRSSAGSVQAPRTGPAPSTERDGSEANPPTDLASVPDAEPRVEPIRSGGPNKPY